MLGFRRTAVLGLLAVSLAAGAASNAMAQTTAKKSSAMSTGTDRLFLAFAQDATLVPAQWWEGQLEYANDINDSNRNAVVARLNAALQPVKNLEIGGRVGVGDTSGAGGGFGATDLDLFAKWHFGTVGDGKTGFAVGGLVTVPTGDDADGLGYESFGLEAFGAMRHTMEKIAISAHAGVRLNGDGQVGAVDLDGKLSINVGAGVLIPVADQVCLVGEANMESERFSEGESDARVLFGVNWRPMNNSVFRGAAGVGLTDGAPDFNVIFGYAYTF